MEYCAMSADDTRNMNCSDTVSLEEKVELALEENISLKSYIERMNNECMELSAALFEEANKMVSEAMSKQYYANRQAKEKMQENEVLRSELRALKILVTELSSDVANEKIRNTLSSTRMKYDNVACNKSPEVYRKMATSNILDPKRNHKRNTGLEHFNRRDLLTAMISNKPCKKHLDLNAFEEFLEWIQSDCPLKLPSIAFTELNEQLCNHLSTNKVDKRDLFDKETIGHVTKINTLNQALDPTGQNGINDVKTSNCIIKDKHTVNSNPLSLPSDPIMSNLADCQLKEDSIDISIGKAKDASIIDRSKHSSNIIRTIIVKSTTHNNHQNNGVGKEPSNELSNTNYDTQPKSTSDVSSHSLVMRSHHNVIESAKLCHIPPNEGLSKFMHRLFVQDIKPCFDNVDRQLISSIYLALPELGLEITPITPITGGNSPRDNTVADEKNPASRESCALMSRYEAMFHMKIRTPNSNETECEISLPARDRIVTVVNLFQYLSIIKRGLDSSPMLGDNRKNGDYTDNRSNITNVQTKNKNDITVNEMENTTMRTEMREQQFRIIQRHRLNIGLARLGYGAPDIE
ncbi:hypothetical protein MN116_007154 [Schistosoma mekongi]|uniref:GDP/GTP exchange factor Sec2 N-terminal domain-containing protein n=1 Tax=Schistosoma mekongi TaxID=38744 RepID=A0AAE1Z9C5_SCHME|nr:hypothetical protein MN116_007154 [Schistosoma mekongi]